MTIITAETLAWSYDTGRKDRVMFFAALFAWTTNHLATRRAARELQALSDRGLSDIGLSRGMIEGIARGYDVDAHGRW